MHAYGCTDVTQNTGPLTSLSSCFSVWPLKEKNKASRKQGYMVLSVTTTYAETCCTTLVPWSNEKTNKVCFRVVVLRYEHLIFEFLIGWPATNANKSDTHIGKIQTWVQ